MLDLNILGQKKEPRAHFVSISEVNLRLNKVFLNKQSLLEEAKKAALDVLNSQTNPISIGELHNTLVDDNPPFLLRLGYFIENIRYDPDFSKHPNLIFNPKKIMNLRKKENIINILLGILKENKEINTPKRLYGAFVAELFERKNVSRNDVVSLPTMFKYLKDDRFRPYNVYQGSKSKKADDNAMLSERFNRIKNDLRAIGTLDFDNLDIVRLDEVLKKAQANLFSFTVLCDGNKEMLERAENMLDLVSDAKKAIKEQAIRGGDIIRNLWIIGYEPTTEDLSSLIFDNEISLAFNVIDVHLKRKNITYAGLENIFLNLSQLVMSSYDDELNYRLHSEDVVNDTISLMTFFESIIEDEENYFPKDIVEYVDSFNAVIHNYFSGDFELLNIKEALRSFKEEEISAGVINFIKAIQERLFKVGINDENSNIGKRALNMADDLEGLEMYMDKISAKDIVNEINTIGYELLKEDIWKLIMDRDVFRAFKVIEFNLKSELINSDDLKVLFKALKEEVLTFIDAKTTFKEAYEIRSNIDKLKSFFGFLVNFKRVPGTKDIFTADVTEEVRNIDAELMAYSFMSAEEIFNINRTNMDNLFSDNAMMAEGTNKMVATYARILSNKTKFNYTMLYDFRNNKTFKSVDETDYSVLEEWRLEKTYFWPKMVNFIEAFPFEFKDTSGLPTDSPYQYILEEVLKNAFDAVVAVYDKKLNEFDVPEGYEGKISLGFDIEDNNLVIKVMDNGIGNMVLSEDFTKRKKALFHTYLGGEGAGLDITTEFVDIGLELGDFVESKLTVATISVPLNKIAIKDNYNELSLQKLLDMPEDNAMISDVGGIDLNAEKLNIESKGEEIDFDRFYSNTEFDNIEINGLVPVILNVTPILPTDVPLILGIAEEEPAEPPLVYLQGLDPFDLIS
ncbi:MAG: ATP-binding protein [Candidatus Zapsychrus exili]|nr:ATP-binding protein [Candidatus Zapsychrus exili]